MAPVRDLVRMFSFDEERVVPKRPAMKYKTDIAGRVTLACSPASCDSSTSTIRSFCPRKKKCSPAISVTYTTPRTVLVNGFDGKSTSPTAWSSHSSSQASESSASSVSLLTERVRKISAERARMRRRQAAACRSAVRLDSPAARSAQQHGTAIPRQDRHEADLSIERESQHCPPPPPEQSPGSTNRQQQADAAQCLVSMIDTWWYGL